MELSSNLVVRATINYILPDIWWDLRNIIFILYFLVFFLFFYLVIKTSMCKCLEKMLCTLSIFMNPSLKTKVKMNWFLLYKINWKEMRAIYNRQIAAEEQSAAGQYWSILYNFSMYSRNKNNYVVNLVFNHRYKYIHAFLISQSVKNLPMV